jgi:hypothetical protein
MKLWSERGTFELIFFAASSRNLLPRPIDILCHSNYSDELFIVPQNPMTKTDEKISSDCLFLKIFRIHHSRLLICSPFHFE